MSVRKAPFELLAILSSDLVYLWAAVLRGPTSFPSDYAARSRLFRRGRVRGPDQRRFGTRSASFCARPFVRVCLYGSDGSVSRFRLMWFGCLRGLAQILPTPGCFVARSFHLRGGCLRCPARKSGDPVAIFCVFQGGRSCGLAMRSGCFVNGSCLFLVASCDGRT